MGNIRQFHKGQSVNMSSNNATNVLLSNGNNVETAVNQLNQSLDKCITSTNISTIRKGTFGYDCQPGMNVIRKSQGLDGFPNNVQNVVSAVVVNHNKMEDSRDSVTFDGNSMFIYSEINQYVTINYIEIS